MSLFLGKTVFEICVEFFPWTFFHEWNTSCMRGCMDANVFLLVFVAPKQTYFLISFFHKLFGVLFYLYCNFTNWQVNLSTEPCSWSPVGNVQDRKSNTLVGIHTCHTCWQAIMLLMRAEEFNSIKNLLEVTVQMWTGPWWIILLGLRRRRVCWCAP